MPFFSLLEKIRRKKPLYWTTRNKHRCIYTLHDIIKDKKITFFTLFASISNFKSTKPKDNRAITIANLTRTFYTTIFDTLFLLLSLSLFSTNKNRFGMSLSWNCLFVGKFTLTTDWCHFSFFQSSPCFSRSLHQTFSLGSHWLSPLL